MNRSPRYGRAAVFSALLWSVAGCSQQDPIDRPGTWQATGANERNLREMIARPSDLDRGVAAVGERGNAGARAATRLYVDRRRPLPNLRSSAVGTQQQEPADTPLPEGNGGGRGSR